MRSHGPHVQPASKVLSHLRLPRNDGFCEIGLTEQILKLVLCPFSDAALTDGDNQITRNSSIRGQHALSNHFRNDSSLSLIWSLASQSMIIIMQSGRYKFLLKSRMISGEDRQWYIRCFGRERRTTRDHAFI